MMASMFACVSTRQRTRRRHPPPRFLPNYVHLSYLVLSRYIFYKSTTEDASEKGNAYGVWKIIIIIINAFCGIIVTSSFLLYIHV